MITSRLSRRLLRLLLSSRQNDEIITFMDVCETCCARPYAVLKALQALGSAGLVEPVRMTLTFEGLAVASALAFASPPGHSERSVVAASSLVEPGPFQPGSADPGAADPDSADAGLADPGSAERASVLPGCVASGSAELPSAGLAPAEPGPAEPAPSEPTGQPEAPGCSGSARCAA